MQNIFKIILTCFVLITSVACNTVIVVADEDTVEFVPLPHKTGISAATPTFNTPTWSVEYVGVGSRLNLTMTQKYNLTLIIRHINAGHDWGDAYSFHVCAVDEQLLEIKHVIHAVDIIPETNSWQGNITMTALFLGRTRIYVELQRENYVPEIASETLDVIIMRNEGLLDTIFKFTVGFFVMILYINFGAALDLDALKVILLRPVGPAIGFIGQFIVMPLLSFLIGYILFHDMIELRLGLFFTGSTPGGGASNIFTVILNGNLNLSITMTALSNLFAFGMMPLWIFTLGALIFRDGNFVIPYKTIATMSCSLVIPLIIGIGLQHCKPELTKRMTRLLKPISLVLMIGIIVFAYTVNYYMFRLFSWKILIASSALPWLGYILGWLLAIVLRQSSKDALTIAIETGIQNTGIAIFMLNFTLPQPQADMTCAVPVASAMMTPLPLLCIYLLRKCFGKRTSIEEIEPPPQKQTKITEVEAFAARINDADEIVTEQQQQQQAVVAAATIQKNVIA